MHSLARLWNSWNVVVLLAFTMAVFASCGDDGDGDPTATPGSTPTMVGEPGDVTVLGIWDGEELASFEAMVAEYEDAGGNVDFTGTRDITDELARQTAAGNPPDVAIPAEVGLFNEFARNGQIISLDQCDGLDRLVRDRYPQGFIDLGTVDGKLYGFFVKADTKGTIWYNPSVFAENDVEPLPNSATFDDLVELSQELIGRGVTPWSIGVGSDATTGWPATDWIQQIILNGPDGESVYDGLIDGSVPFTDARVKAAFERFGEIVLGDGMTAQAGAPAIIATDFEDSVEPPFDEPPTAAMVFLGGFASGFITARYPDLVPVEDYDFFTFPGGAITGGANIVYAFNDEPATCSLLTYLASSAAQQVWVERGGFTSVNADVPLDAYGDAIDRKQAEQLLGANVFRFDLDDAIGGDLQQALFQGMVDFLTNPDDLDAILAEIEAARGR